MFFALLCVAFVGFQDTTEATNEAQRIFQLCEQEAERKRDFMVHMVNRKIAFLAFVRKAKIRPGESRQVSTGVAMRDDNPHFVAIFPTQRDKTAYEKELRAEILEDKLALIRFRPTPDELPSIWAGNTGPIGIPLEGAIQVRTILGKESCIIRFPPFSESREYHLQGMNTDGLADDMRVKTNVPLVQSGTFSWGASTLVSYRVMKDSEIDELAKLMLAVDVGEKVRPWESADRKHTTRAKLVGFDLKKVKLQREDGEAVELELGKLSTEDQAYVKRVMGLDPL
jgi:hypothetical protein